MIKIRKKLIKILIIIILFSFGVTVEAEQQSSVNNTDTKTGLFHLFKSAKQKGKEYKEKLEMKYYEEQIKEQPKNIQLLETYAKYLKDHGYYDKSIRAYRALIKLTKNNKYKTEIKQIQAYKDYSDKENVFTQYINQAKEFESKGQIKEANELYEKAFNIFPQRYEAKFGLAKTYGWLGKKEIADKYYKELLKTAPDNKDLLEAYNKFSGKNLGLPTKPQPTTQKQPSNQKLVTKTVYPQKQNVPDVYSEYIKKAQFFENKGQIEKANEYYLKAQKINASRYEAKFGLARTYGWLHKDDLATKYYNELLKQTPNNADLLGFYADFLTSIKKYQESLDIYQKLLAKTNNQKYEAKIAEVYFSQQKFQEALKLYTDIYEKNPNNPEIQKAIARLYFLSGDFNKSIEYYEKYFSQKSDPESVVIYSKSLFYSKQTQPAKQILESYLAQYPNDVEGLSTLADIYLSLRKPEGAMNLVNKALSIEPENFKLKIQSAKVDISLKDYETAENKLLTLLETSPNNPEILENLGDISLYKGNFVKALDYYQSIDNFRDNKRLKYKIAQAHHFNKDYILGEYHYQGLVNDPEYSIKARIGIAEIRIIQDKPLQARKILNKVLAEDPENIQAKKNMAISRYTTGDNLTAISILKELPKDDPDISDINYNLAKSYYKIDRNDLALDLLENNPQENAKTLRAEIKMQIRPALEPFFDLYHMSGNANAGKYFKMGGNGYYYIRPNIRLTGNASTVEYRNVTDLLGTRGTIVMGGAEGKLTDHLGFQGSAGYEFFDNYYADSIILARALLKWYPNDVVTWTGGYIRSLDEIDSYMSAAGVVPTTGPFAGQLVGRIIDNKFVSDFAFKLPYKFYAYGGFRLGYKYGSNSPPNTYSEIPAGFGKVFYSGKETNAINQILLGYDCYYTAYGVDRSGFGGANLLYSPVGSDGQNPEPTPGAAGVGGYFSPTFFLANKFPITIKGSFKETKLKYAISAFWGLQTIQGQIGLLGLSNLTPGTIVSYQYFGYSAGLRYNEKGRVSLALDYIFNNYMTVAQHLFKVSLLFRF